MVTKENPPLPFKKWLIVTEYFHPEPGATQIRLMATIKNLQQAGAEVTVLTGMPNYPTGVIDPPYRGKLYVTEEHEGIKIHRTWLYPCRSQSAVGRILNYLSHTATAFLAAPLLPRPDVVFVEAQPITMAFVGLFAKLFRGVPYIYNTPDLQVEIAGELNWTPIGILLRLARNMERHLMKRSFSVSTVTRAFIQHFHEQRDLPLEQISFLPNGADTDVLYPKGPDPAMLERFGVAGKTVFTYAGTHAKYQGLEVIVAAAGILKARGRDDIRIIMVGKGPIRQTLIQTAAEQGIDNIIFGESPFSEAADLMSITDCALVALRDMPAAAKMRLSKTFPPLACGVPVLFAGRGESSDLVRDEGLGWVCPPEDPQALAAAMAEIAADPAERKRRGERGAAYVRENLSWKAIVANWLEEIRRRKESLESRRPS